MGSLKIVGDLAFLLCRSCLTKPKLQGFGVCCTSAGVSRGDAEG